MVWNGKLHFGIILLCISLPSSALLSTFDVFFKANVKIHQTGRPPCQIPLNPSPRIEMALNSLNLNLNLKSINSVQSLLFFLLCVVIGSIFTEISGVFVVFPR